MVRINHSQVISVKDSNITLSNGMIEKITDIRTKYIKSGDYLVWINNTYIVVPGGEKVPSYASLFISSRDVLYLTRIRNSLDQVNKALRKLLVLGGEEIIALYRMSGFTNIDEFVQRFISNPGDFPLSSNLARIYNVAEQKNKLILRIYRACRERGSIRLNHQEPFVKINDKYITTIFERNRITFIGQTLRQLSDRVLDSCGEWENIDGLSHDQRRAFSHVKENGLTIIHGAPGTGKTHLVSEIIRAFKYCAIVIAPTGKAVSLYRERDINAKTIDSFLLTRKEHPNVEMIIIDEISMVTISHMWGILLGNNIKLRRLVVVGDPNQLPPVSSYQVNFPVKPIILTEHHRGPNFLKVWESLISTGRPQGDFIEYREYWDGKTPRNKSWIIVTPLRSTRKLICQYLSKVNSGKKQPYIYRANKDDHWNGEMFWADQSSEESAWALTCHLSQGSEWDTVYLILDGVSAFIDANLIYTAVSRARKKCIIFGWPSNWKCEYRNRPKLDLIK
jgi:hypothetical protein